MRRRLGHLGIKAKCLMAIFVVFILFSSLSAFALHAYRMRELRASAEPSSPTLSSSVMGPSISYPLRLQDLGYIFAAGLIPAVAVALLVLDKSVASRLRTITRVANTMRYGELGREIEVEGRDEISQLVRSLNRAFGELRRGQETVLRKISSLRQFNELLIRERHSNDGVMVMDKGGKISYASGKSLELLGYTPEELLDRPLSSFLAPGSPGGIVDLLSSPQQADRTRRQEVVLVDRAETLIPARITSTNLFRQGELAGALLVVADLRKQDELVDNLKGMQSRLRRSSIELSKKLWELSVVKEVVHTLQTTLSLDQVLRIILTGVTAEQGLGFNRAFLLLLDEKTRCLEGKLAVGPSDPHEASRIWEGLRGQSHSLHKLLEMHRDASGQFDPGVNQIVKKMKFNLAPESGIVARSVLEGKNFNITEGNESTPVDRQLAELLGAEAFVVVPLMARGRPLGAVIADNCFTRRPIEEADVELLETLANHAGFAIERAHLYEQLTRKVQELEQAYKNLKESQDQLLRAERFSAVGKMATRLTHELRNPIVSLGGFVRLMSKGLPQEDSNREYLGIITEEVARLEKLLTEVLEFARPVSPSFEMVSINEVVKKAVLMMQPEIDRMEIAAHMDLQMGLPKIRLDPIQIGQVLLNILRNGLEAMSSGGELFVRTRGLGENIRVEVEDTGVGIPQEHLDKLFSEFFTTKSAGVGLGLAMAYQTIQNHRGTISVRSQEGKGSSFFIDLPVDPEEPQERAPEMETA